MKGRKRHVAVDSSGLLLGVVVHAADIQDADGVGDLLRRLKRLYCWLRAVFADGAYDRLAVLLACFALGLTLIVIRRLAGTEGFGEQGHDREQREQAGRGAGDRPVRPLPLGLDAEMVAHLAEGDLHLPALDEPADDLQRVAGGIGAQQGLRVEAALGVAQQHPADRHDRQAGVAPDGGRRSRSRRSRSPSPYQPGTGHPLPARVLVGQDLGEVRQARALGPRTPDVPGRRGGAGS